MKLIDVQVSGFGVWSGLELNDLSPHSTVFYGSNEAGKTTLLQFLRATLYGFSPARRDRYLPPLRGSTAGGTLTIRAPEFGHLRICRQECASDSLGAVTILNADGAEHRVAQLHELLHDVDESTYQNVFAIGLYELQELGTLTGAEVAQSLYALATGLDRVSLCDVLRDLERARQNLWTADDKHSEIRRLLGSRDRLQADVENLQGQSRRYGQLLAENAAAEVEINRIEQANIERDAESRALETAILVYDTWRRRSSLDAQIDAAGPHDRWPHDAPAQMERILQAHLRRRRQLRRVVANRKHLAVEFAAIKLNEPLCQQSARIAALAINEPWIVSLEQELRQAEAAVQSITAERKTICDALPGSATLSMPRGDRQDWAKLRRPASAVAKAKRRAAAAQQRLAELQDAAQGRRNELQLAVAALGHNNLTAALQAAGERAAKLRQRAQLDERIEQISHSRGDLELHIGSLLERQMLPPWMLLALGGIFVLGAVLILAGLLLPHSFTGDLGWPMAFLGLLATGAAVATKYTVERSVSNQLDASRKQFELLGAQLEQSHEQRDELDQVLTNTGGTLAARLQLAEQELARLEELLPLDAQRESADHSMSQADGQMKQSRHEFHQALGRWRQALTDAQLPADLTPNQVRAIAGSSTQLRDVEQRLTAAESELDRRRRELAVLGSRVEHIFQAAELPSPPGQLSQRLRFLNRELATQEQRQLDRDSIRNRQARLRRRQRMIRLRLRQLRRRRRRLLKTCHVANLAEFRHRAAAFSRIAALIGQRDQAASEIASVLPSAAAEALIGSLISDHTSAQLAEKLSQARRHIEDARLQLRSLLEQRGQRNEQLRLLADDRRLAVQRFHLAQVDEKLAAATHRWQVLTATQGLLLQIKDDYERHRQPEALCEASGYLTQLTGGRYRRVWTALGENALKVDDEQGRSLPIEVLSHGTREQLFLSLRLALVGMFSRRGVELPMVLDDVLVNFDTQRAQAAVQVLRDFAQRGHQLLVFTCHDHIARLFKSQGCDVRRLPSHERSGHDQPLELEDHLPVRRNRSRRETEEVEIEHPVVAATMVETVMPATQVEVHFVEPPTELAAPAPLPIVNQPVPVMEPRAQHLRIDLPQKIVRLSPIFRRWGAEEFSGELDDRVNPQWLLNGTVSIAARKPATHPTTTLPQSQLGDEDSDL